MCTDYTLKYCKKNGPFVMDTILKDNLIKYFKQQCELNYPNYIFSSSNFLKKSIYPVSSEDSNKERSLIKNSDLEDSYQTQRDSLIKLFNECKECKKCTLSTTRKKMVFGAGNVSAYLMVIGEAPGNDEDIQGMPFVGKAGVLLTKMLSAIKIDRRKDTFITNILKCRPPENRNPNQNEILACKPFLNKQIEILKPKLILVLGKIAANELLNTSEGIGKLRTTQHNYNMIPVIVTYHPSALLRNQKYKKPAWEDLQKLQTLLIEKGWNENSKE